MAAHRVRDWAALVRRQAAVGGGVLIARSAHGALGLCQFGPTEEDDDPRRVGHVYRLYVHPRHQGMGFGRALLIEATSRMRQREFQAATLWVLESDERARRFYEGLGWRPDGGRRFDGVSDVRYRLTL